MLVSELSRQLFQTVRGEGKRVEDTSREADNSNPGNVMSLFCTCVVHVGIITNTGTGALKVICHIHNAHTLLSISSPTSHRLYSTQENFTWCNLRKKESFQLVSLWPDVSPGRIIYYLFIYLLLFAYFICAILIPVPRGRCSSPGEAGSWLMSLASCALTRC